MNSFVTIGGFVNRHSLICVMLALYLLACQRASDVVGPAAHSNAGILQSETGPGNLALLEEVEINPTPSINASPESIVGRWPYISMPLSEYRMGRYHTRAVWTRLQLKNTDTITHVRVLYFPKGWSHLECYSPQPDGSLLREDIGSQYDQEVVTVHLQASEVKSMYVHYPASSTAYYPSYEVMELTSAMHRHLESRAQLKFLLLGILIFPLLYFLVQLAVRREKVNLYYLLFLGGSGAYLVTMLDTIPYFELSQRIVSSMDVIQRLFVASTFLLLLGLVKYIHEFLLVFTWSRLLGRIGNVLLMTFLVVALIPFLFQNIFLLENYDSYLRYLRPIALGIFIYTIILTVRGVVQRVVFSRLLLIAFAPFLLSALTYALSFILIGGYRNDSIESLAVIVGFIATLLLFGVMLGVRNKAVEAEKLRLEREAEHLNEMDRFKSRFYTNITHEFRTPLTVIKGMISQIAGNDKLKTTVQRNCDQLLTMVNQLLDLSRLESSRMAITWVHGDILPYLRYLTESFHSLAKDKQLNLAFFSRDEHIEMDFDEQKIQQIITNLLSNAIKFTPLYGSVKVIASTFHENDKTYFKLTISDTGHGIPKEHLPHIFDRFFQSDNKASQKGEGSGIGLSLVRELVELMEGSIHADSEPDVGSSFHVLLPVRHLSVASPTGKVIDVPVGGDMNGTDDLEAVSHEDRPLLLIIEDNTDVTNYIVSCLSGEYQLLTARDGKTGVEKAFEHIPDVILSDVMMPEMDGFEVCQRLKTDRKTSHIPIVLLTAKAAQEDRREGLSHGADAYLTKPFDKEELMIRLTNLAAQSRRLRELLSQRASPDSAIHAEVTATREVAFLKELDQIIDSQMSDDTFDTLQLCKMIGMSRTQLHRKLKSLTGKSTASYIRSFRLQQARALLATTDLPIGEIASRVGYKDFSHFSKSFHKEFGAQPSVMRG